MLEVTLNNLFNMDNFQEKRLFQRFKESYNNFPVTIEERIDDQDQPDSVIITPDNKKIGIELTEMYQDNKNSKSNGSDLKKTEGAYKKIGNLIVEEVANHSSKKFELDISFRMNAKLCRENRQKIIKELTSLIIECLPNLEPGKPLKVPRFRKLHNGTIRKLPDGINDFYICNKPEIPTSRFLNSHSHTVGDLTNSHVETVLRDKNKDIENYDEFDEQWLVIKIGNFMAGSFGENKIDKSFKSKFNKVFIHDIQTSETLELEVKK